MSNEIIIHHLNVRGKYYVDAEACIDHARCADEAPENFRMDEHWSAYVFKQPASAEEEKKCRNAMETCPVAAIHDNGDNEL